MPGWLVVLLVGVGCGGTCFLLGFGTALWRGVWSSVDRDYLPSVN